MKNVFVYAEYQVSMPFSSVPWREINADLKRVPGLRSKTWLSGVNNNTVGGFYEFESLDAAQKYIDEMLVPYAKQIKGSLSVKVFDGEAVAAASAGIASPFYAGR